MEYNNESFEDKHNYREDMENVFEKGDIKDFVNSLKDDEYRNYIQKKYEIILQSFEKVDKNKDSVIDYEELLSFLDGSMTVNNILSQSGKKFDRDLADKIMKLIDVDQNGQISL